MLLVLFRLSRTHSLVEPTLVNPLSPRTAKELLKFVDKATVVTYCQFHFVKRWTDFVCRQQGQTQKTANDVLHVWFTNILVLETQFMYAFDNGLREMKPTAGDGNISKDATKCGNRRSLNLVGIVGR